LQKINEIGLRNKNSDDDAKILENSKVVGDIFL
jgi:hypothetical protein